MMKIPDLCNLIQVSPATMRRDLAELESAGLISRINGGALLKGQHFADYSEAHHISADPYLQPKKAIAEAAVTLVNPGDTIFIDPGSTNNQIANLLTSFSDISIVTNSIEIAYKFVAKKDISVIVCGGTIGEVDPRASIVGPLAEKMISMFRANIFFLGTSGIDIKHGITDPYLSAARIKEKMIEHSSKVVLVTDHSKFGRVNKAFVSSLDNIHHVITDNQAPESDLDALTKMGITVTIV
jgi:DeoR/GlpR family transcriptional regulator of sugar metabolism